MAATTKTVIPGVTCAWCRRPATGDPHSDYLIDHAVNCPSLLPDGSEYYAAAIALLNLTREQRVEVMALFCRECGAQNYVGGSQCRCWDDE